MPQVCDITQTEDELSSDEEGRTIFYQENVQYTEWELKAVIRHYRKSFRKLQEELDFMKKDRDYHFNKLAYVSWEFGESNWPKLERKSKKQILQKIVDELKN